MASFVRLGAGIAQSNLVCRSKKVTKTGAIIIVAWPFLNTLINLKRDSRLVLRC